MRPLLAMLAAFALIAAACGGGEASSDDDAAPAATAVPDDAAPDAPADTDDPVPADDEPADDEPDEAAPTDEVDCADATASDVGVTADTITVGLISVDLENLFGTGFVDELTNDMFYTRNFSLIHAINEAGGINCRQIELVQETYDPARGAETQVPACERLAQDNEIFVAIAAFPDSAGGGHACLYDRFEIPFVTSGPISESAFEAAGGLMVSVRPSVEVMARTAAQTYIDLGVFEGEKVAVWGGDSGELGTARELVVSLLLDAGIDTVDVALPSSGGTTAVWGVGPQVVASMVEQDVTSVVMLGSSVTVNPFFLEMQRSGADWNFFAVDTQAAGGLFTAAKMPDDWTATAVTSLLHEPRTDEGDQECIEAYELLRSSGMFPDEAFEGNDPKLGNTNTTRPLSDECALVKLIILGLQNAGLNPTRASFVEAVNNLGPVDIAFETDGVLEPGKGYLSDSANIYTRYGPGAPECIDLGYFAELGCWGPYAGADPGEIENVTG